MFFVCSCFIFLIFSWVAIIENQGFNSWKLFPNIGQHFSCSITVGTWMVGLRVLTGSWMYQKALNPSAYESTSFTFVGDVSSKTLILYWSGWVYIRSLMYRFDRVCWILFKHVLVFWGLRIYHYLMWTHGGMVKFVTSFWIRKVAGGKDMEVRWDVFYTFIFAFLVQITIVMLTIGMVQRTGTNFSGWPMSYAALS